jgi:hypothetical protein
LSTAELKTTYLASRVTVPVPLLVIPQGAAIPLEQELLPVEAEEAEEVVEVVASEPPFFFAIT